MEWDCSQGLWHQRVVLSDDRSLSRMSSLSLELCGDGSHLLAYIDYDIRELSIIESMRGSSMSLHLNKCN